jgi:hypothetical protein
VTKEDSGVYGGYYFEVLRMIAEHLNFTIRMTEPDDGEWGVFNRAFLRTESGRG